YECFWNPAQRKGYSGVAILTKEKPENIVVGLGNELYDIEGRIIRANYKNYSLISVYVPSGTMGDVRQDFKMDFLDVFYNHLNDVRKEHPNLIVSGDYNICHKPIDINHPERHNNVSGFLPEERVWVDKLTENGFIDTFRIFNNEPNQYSWWSYRAGARQKNLGWRIDYHMVSEPMRNNIKNATIHPNEFHSDHCPVSIEVDI
ncbi:MAG: exodeoxyribonuclease III, partial [Bacteroidetes bacterium GWA2_30_7]